MIKFYAKLFARIAHGLIRQKRKYTGERYTVHTEAVANMVKSAGGSKYQIAAAYLHDYREDVVTELAKRGRFKTLAVLEHFYMKFPNEVRQLVFELTDEFTSEIYPNMNRVERKKAEAVRIGGISNEAKTIKLADLYDNTSSIVEHDEGFARIYLKEKARVLPHLEGGDRLLAIMVKHQLEYGVAKLDIVL